MDKDAKRLLMAGVLFALIALILWAVYSRKSKNDPDDLNKVARNVSIAAIVFTVAAAGCFFLAWAVNQIG